MSSESPTRSAGPVSSTSPASPASPVFLRPYEPADALATLKVYTRATREIARLEFSLAEVLGFAASDRPVIEWNDRRAAVDTRVAFIDGVVVGFAGVAGDGRIDMLFVKPGDTRRGVGAALLASLGDGPLFTDASIAMRGFFERHGFVVESSRQVLFGAQSVTDFRMARAAV